MIGTDLVQLIHLLVFFKLLLRSTNTKVSLLFFEQEYPKNFSELFQIFRTSQYEIRFDNLSNIDLVQSLIKVLGCLKWLHLCFKIFI